MTFHVGQKIVCIEDNWAHPLQHLVKHLPRKGTIYHVRGFAPTEYGGDQYIWLCEVNNPPFISCEPSFASICFRPVVENKTDISIFTAMLTGRKLETVMTDDAARVRSPGIESNSAIRAADATEPASAHYRRIRAHFGDQQCR